MFVEDKKIDLSKKYKASAVAKLVAGQYGADTFSKEVSGTTPPEPLEGGE
jgi:hypothetical protein